MEIRKLTLSLLWASASFATAMAQYTGVILDPEKQPLEYANVALLHPQDSTLIAGGMTDSDGSFCISTKESPVIVRVSYPGYNPLYKDAAEKNVGIISMTEGAMLAEVTVTANGGKLISQKVDRLIYDVANDPFASNKTAIQLLEQTPRIMVNQKEATLSMVGREGVNVMIDGRILSGEESKSFLSNLRAEEISSIEVIPIPPAKYNSEGNIGLVNIRLKPNPSIGFQGDLSLNYDHWRLLKSVNAKLLNSVFMLVTRFSGLQTLSHFSNDYIGVGALKLGSPIFHECRTIHFQPDC